MKSPDGLECVKQRVVYRINDDALHRRLVAFLEVERARTGWDIGHGAVVERALREFLDKHQPAKSARVAK